MKLINYISSAAMPIIIMIIILVAINEKKKTYDIFLDGAKEGLIIVYNIFPTLIGIFMAVGMLRSSGILEFIIKLISPIINSIRFPPEVMPLAILRPISGSASMAIATDIMKQYGTDSYIGLVTSTIMGSTETTFYTIALYTSCIKIKKTRCVLPIALAADLTGMIVSVIIWRILS